MAKSGPIILIEDDPDDAEIFADILKELEITNKLTWFTNSAEGFDFLKKTTEQPFLIFCDVNLPGENGIEFKRRIDDDKELRRRSIPFVFYTTTADQKAINEAYTEMTVQGFFKKRNSVEEMKEDVHLIFTYWQSCKHPNTE